MKTRLEKTTPKVADLPGSTTDNILEFRFNKFGNRDLAELMRWNSVSQADGWYVQVLDIGGKLIERTEDGDEYVVITRDAPDNEAVFMIEPQQGRWDLVDCYGRLLRSFKTLSEALAMVNAK